MKLTIGENIRTLRREKEMTQEEFAAVFGVTYQSVSRWENDSCYPDMTLLPEIAGFFGITVDRLIGADRGQEQKAVDGYLARFREALSRGLVYDCIAIAREGVAEYPNNYALLNKLMYALFLSGDDTGNVAEWEENMHQFDAEIVSLGERITRYCPDQDIRLEATARLAFQHREMGRIETARAIYATLPSTEYCRENHIWWGLREDEKEEFLHKKIKSDYANLYSYIWSLASSKFLSDREAIAAYEKVFALEELITDGTEPPHHWGDARLHYEIARRYLGLGEIDAAFAQLERCADAALAFDMRPDTQSYTCLLLGEIIESRLDFETTDSRPLCAIVREDWLAEPALDAIRGDARFAAIVARLAAV